jgi:thiol-disulfide isomerase/thioredoxin
MSTSSMPVLDIVCLCAAWCGTCREYDATFEQLKRTLPAHRYRWIDIEDEAELVGDIDVETFPTVLVAWQGQVLFAGPVLPRLGDVQRLVEVQLKQAERGQVPGGAAALGLPMDQWTACTQLAQALNVPA